VAHVRLCYLRTNPFSVMARLARGSSPGGLRWKAGVFPIVDPSSGSWSCTPTLVLPRTFTNWVANGDFGIQTFLFASNQAPQYISLAVTGKNHKVASYVTFDVLPPAAPWQAGAATPDRFTTRAHARIGQTHCSARSRWTRT
jgi:hypothetical protein